MRSRLIKSNNAYMFNDDYYNQNDSNDITFPSYDKEHRIYMRLYGLFQTLPEQSNTYTTLPDLDLMEQYNQILDQLISLGHDEYSKDKILSDKLTTFNGRAVINTNLVRSRMNGTLWDMSSKYTFQTPNELSKNRPSNTTMQQITNQSQSQQQEQSQQIHLTIEQRLEQLQELIDENLSVDQITMISTQLEEFKKEPKHWKNAQALIGGVLMFGKDIAVQVIAAIIAFYVTK